MIWGQKHWKKEFIKIHDSPEDFHLGFQPFFLVYPLRSGENSTANRFTLITTGFFMILSPIPVHFTKT